MNHLNDNKTIKQITHFADDGITLVVLATIVGVVLYAAMIVWGLLTSFISPAYHIEDMLHTVAVIVVLVKAYRLLVFYMESHHVSIKYVMEISIIAPAVEIIFAPGNRPLSLNILYGVFSVAVLLIYMFFYNKLEGADEKCVKDHGKKLSK